MDAEMLRKALQRAYSLGQTYWQQADSESLRQHELADKTQAMFDKLLEDTVAACGALERYEPIGRYFMRDGEWIKAAPESPVGETLYRRTYGVAPTRGALTKGEVDALVYQCRQAGDDSTYALVRAVEAAHASGVAGTQGDQHGNLA